MNWLLFLLGSIVVVNLLVVRFAWKFNDARRWTALFVLVQMVLVGVEAMSWDTTNKRSRLAKERLELGKKFFPGFEGYAHYHHDPVAQRLREEFRLAAQMEATDLEGMLLATSQTLFAIGLYQFESGQFVDSAFAFERVHNLVDTAAVENNWGVCLIFSGRKPAGAEKLESAANRGLELARVNLDALKNNEVELDLWLKTVSGGDRE